MTEQFVPTKEHGQHRYTRKHRTGREGHVSIEWLTKFTFVRGSTRWQIQTFRHLGMESFTTGPERFRPIAHVPVYRTVDGQKRLIGAWECPGPEMKSEADAREWIDDERKAGHEPNAAEFEANPATLGKAQRFDEWQRMKAKHAKQCAAMREKHRAERLSK